MFLFEKPIYKYQEMRFILDEFTNSGSDDKSLIDIEAYGYIDGEMKCI